MKKIVILPIGKIHKIINGFKLLILNEFKKLAHSMQSQNQEYKNLYPKE
jgi:hypothetical protein